MNAIGSLLDCCRKSGDFSAVLDQLKKSIQMAPQNLDLREMLGQAYLAAKDPENGLQGIPDGLLDGRVAL